MTLMKRILFTALYVLIALFLPLTILTIFVDATEKPEVWFIVLGAILFASVGLVLANAVSLRKTFESTLEDIKMQNAAIAFKLTSVFKDNPEALDALMQHASSTSDAEDVIEPIPSFEEENEKPAVDTSRVTLNPADPLVFPEPKFTDKKPKDDKKSDGEKKPGKKNDRFDDFD